MKADIELDGKYYTVDYRVYEDELEISYIIHDGKRQDPLDLSDYILDEMMNKCWGYHYDEY